MIRTLAELLHPITVDEFVAEYWGKKPVHISGSSDKFAGVFERDTFFEFAKSPRADMFVGKADERRHFHQLSTTAYNARALFCLGLTVQLEDLHWCCTPVRELVAAIKDALGMYAAMEAAAFLSPPGAGYGVHYDPNPSIWALQISGEKTWRYSPQPAAKYPIEHVTLNPTGKPTTSWVDLERPDESKFEVAHMTPGDVFYFPAGVWHTAAASEESCHLVLGSQIAPWTDFIFDKLKDNLLGRADWRQIPLAHPALGRGVNETLAERLRELAEMVEGLDSSPDSELIAAFENEAQTGNSRGNRKGACPWAYRARRVSYAEAESLIDLNTEAGIKRDA